MFALKSFLKRGLESGSYWISSKGRGRSMMQMYRSLWWVLVIVRSEMCVYISYLEPSAIYFYTLNYIITIGIPREYSHILGGGN